MGLFRLLELKKRFAAAGKLSPEGLDELQKKNIREMVSHACTHSEYYKKLYKGKSADELLKKGFSSLPTVGKKKIMDNFNQVVTNPVLEKHKVEHYMASKPVGTWYAKKYRVIHTSGSSGTIGIFSYDDLAWDKLRACALARSVDFGILFKIEKMAFMGATDGHYAGMTLASDVPKVVAACKQISVHAPIEEMVYTLNRFKPTKLSGYPSGLLMLANEQLSGRLNIKPGSILSSAEPLDKRTRHLVKEAFGVDPYNFYAASESIGIAQECSEHHGMHVFTDQNVVELVDDKGTPVPPGKPGKVILTNLYNKAQPLIRYTMKDVAVYSKEPCECGLPFPILKEIEGREEDSIWVENSKGCYECLHSAFIVEFFVPGLQKLQLVQKERNKIVLRLVARENKEKVAMAARCRIGEILSSKKLQHTVQCEIEMVDSIPPDPKTGKTKIVLAMKKPRGIS
jgi:putative adenylate-forming enzyme